ncbi:MAG: PfkB family carbohydrate kinase [Chthoniobacterales bacterium]
MSVLVVGSIALDTVKTPVEEHADLLGGSASFAAVSASFFTSVNMVGIVGTDFPKEHVKFFSDHKINTEGLQVVEGKTFRWSGEYMWDMNSRETRSVALNVFEHFTPKLPASYTETPYILLANIAPSLQHHVLNQIKKPKFVIADTMDLWISTAVEDMLSLMKRVDMLILNDSEARQLTKQTSLIKAGYAILEQGPKYVAIKKGEHGCLLFGKGRFFSCPAYPLEEIKDPTGAGDTFAGGLAGYLASVDGGEVTFDKLRMAVVYGSVLASFNVESFSMDRLQTIKPADIEERYHLFRMMSQFESLK